MEFNKYFFRTLSSIFFVSAFFLIFSPSVFAADQYVACEDTSASAYKCVTESVSKAYPEKYINCEAPAPKEACEGQLSGLNGFLKLQQFKVCYYLSEGPTSSECVPADTFEDKSIKACYTPKSKDACEAQKNAIIANEQKAQTTICCFPPASKKKDIACAEIKANYSNKEEVDTKCAAALGGDDNYAQKANDKCSKYSECKNTGAKQKTGSGTGSAGTGTGVKPTNKPVGGGNFEIGSLKDPLGSFTVPGFIGTLIRSMLSVVGTIALVLFIYAGIMWMTAAGNEERTRSAAKIMLWTVLGLVVIFASYILVTFVFSAL